MSFPASPLNGEFVVVNNITYQFDASKSAWIRVLSVADNLTVNNLSVIKTLSGNISGGNVYATGFYWAGNGESFVSSLYSNTNVAGYLAGNITTGNLTSTGNIIGGGVRNTASSTPPVNPFPGDTWYDTDNDVLLRYVDDGDSSQWVDITGIIVGTINGGYKFTTSPTPPLYPLPGDNWYDTSTDILFRYVTDGISSVWLDNSSIGVEYQTYSNVEVAAYISSGNLAFGNLSASNYYWANGTPFASSNYSDTNVAAYLTGNITTGNVLAVKYYWANGAPLSTYSNSSVASYLPVNPTIIALQSNASAQSVEISNLRANIIATNAAIVTANTGMKNYVDHNNYSNVNTAGYLAGNVTVGNISINALYWSNGSPYVFAGVTLNSRTVANVVTSNIAGNAVANVSVTGYKGYNLYKIYSSHAAWIRIYSSTDARNTDASRNQGTDPTPDVGVLTEVITSTPATTIKLSPAVLGYNDETVPTTAIPIAVTNLSGGANAITISLTLVQTEM